jgi:hypothetical protein
VTFKIATKNNFFKIIFFLLQGLHLHNFSKIKSHKEVKKTGGMKVCLTIFA